jgi:protein-tyrosine-phosphatase
VDVLVVCSGNICRSPYAAGYLRHHLAAQPVGGGAVGIRSAGTLGIVGSPPSPETLALAREAGFDLSGHRSRALEFDLVDEADAILVMEHVHREEIEARYPEDAGKIHLLSEFHPEAAGLVRPPDIFDPIGLPLTEYRRCFQLVRESLERFVRERLRSVG